VTGARAFVGVGSNDGDPPRRIAAALAALDAGPTRVAAAARPQWSAYEGGDGPDVLDSVVELRTTLAPRVLLARLRELETAAGRVRDGRTTRTLDLDLLDYQDVVCREEDLVLPHPRGTRRAFVVFPWAEVAPLHVVAGTGATVVEHAAALRAAGTDPAASLRPHGLPAFADRRRSVEVLQDRAALAAWRARQDGVVGVVMTLGALHAGHASLVQRAAAECDAVLATIFVNPTQFAPGEDLARYPRTFDDDLALLARHGADALYAPTPEDVYPAGFATTVHPAGAAQGYEGASRPTHFSGVATVVTKLWQRTRAQRSYFAHKDAQQLAVLRQVRRDLDLEVEIVPCPTVRAPDGLALSSRNRWLDEPARATALSLSRTLEEVAGAVARGQAPADVLPALRARGQAQAGASWDYLDVVDPDRMRPLERVEAPALAVGALRVGDVRLIDNCWVAPAAAGGRA
jgi:pantoate--beta-alanine ligase